jgi:hypothetical protein
MEDIHANRANERYDPQPDSDGVYHFTAADFRAVETIYLALGLPDSPLDAVVQDGVWRNAAGMTPGPWMARPDKKQSDCGAGEDGN